MLSSATKAAGNVTKASAENDLRGAAHDIEKQGKEALNNVADYANEAGQKVRGLYDQAIDQGGRLSKNVETEIRANPVVASAIALGAGFILGALLTRR